MAVTGIRTPGFPCTGKKEGCDLIVCWVNNSPTRARAARVGGPGWPECPVEVIELRKVVREMWEEGG